MGRAQLFSALLVHFNHVAAASLAAGITVVVMFIAGVVESYTGVCILPYNAEMSSMFTAHGWHIVQWSFSVPCRLFLSLLFLLTFRQVVSRDKLFLDKNCINQVARIALFPERLWSSDEKI